MYNAVSSSSAIETATYNFIIFYISCQLQVYISPLVLHEFTIHIEDKSWCTLLVADIVLIDNYS